MFHEVKKKGSKEKKRSKERRMEGKIEKKEEIIVLCFDLVSVQLFI